MRGVLHRVAMAEVTHPPYMRTFQKVVSRKRWISDLLLIKSLFLRFSTIPPINKGGMKTLAEQIVPSDDVYDHVRVCVAHQTVRYDHREMDGLFRSGLVPKSLDFVAKVFFVLRRDGELGIGILHLADVDDAVPSLDNQIDLSAGS